jgi:hypothetical protein
VSRVWPFMSPLADKPDALDVAREQTLDTVDEQDDGDTACTSKDGKHSWRRDRDWMGDPSIPNGTCEWNVYRCIECGYEHPGEPPNYYEPEPPDRDDARDRDSGEYDDEVQF